MYKFIICIVVFCLLLQIVQSCVACLAVVVNKVSKNYKLVNDCYTKFYSESIITLLVGGVYDFIAFNSLS